MRLDVVSRVPDGWDVAPLWAFFRRVKRVGHEDEELLSVYRDYGVIPKSSRTDNFNKPSDDLSSYQLVEPGDLVVNKMKAWQGSVAVSEYRGIVSPAYFVYTPHRELFGRFAHYLFRSQPYFSWYRAISKGIRPNQWDLIPEDFARIPVLTPPTKVQRSIAEFLDHETAKIDAMVDAQMRLVDSLSERRRSVIHHVVSKGLGASDRINSGVSWLGDVPSHWNVLALRRVARFTTGITPPTEDETNYVEGVDGHPWVRPEDLRPSGDPTKASRSLSASGWQNVRPVPPGSILLCCIGATLGKVGIVNEAVATNQQITSVTSTLDPRFSFHALTASYDGFRSASVGNTLPILNNDKLGSVPVPVPPEDEQREIADFLDRATSKIDAMAAKAQESITLMTERRAALISAAVTGRIDVRTGNEHVERDLNEALR